MGRAGDPGQGPAATNALQPNSITPIELVVGGWRFTFALGAEPSTGEVRDLAATVSDVAGVGRESALEAVLAAIAAPPIVWAAAA
jgi:hypothetical protein